MMDYKLIIVNLHKYYFIYFPLMTTKYVFILIQRNQYKINYDRQI